MQSKSTTNRIVVAVAVPALLVVALLGVAVSFVLTPSVLAQSAGRIAAQIGSHEPVAVAAAPDTAYYTDVRAKLMALDTAVGEVISKSKELQVRPVATNDPIWMQALAAKAGGALITAQAVQQLPRYDGAAEVHDEATAAADAASEFLTHHSRAFAAAKAGDTATVAAEGTAFQQAFTSYSLHMTAALQLIP